MGTRAIIRVLLAASLTLPLCAESAMLKNGFGMRLERHVTEDQTVRLFLSGGGTREVAAGDIDRFEPDEPSLPPIPAAAPPPAVVLAKNARPHDDIVRAASARHGLDPDFIHS